MTQNASNQIQTTNLDELINILELTAEDVKYNKFKYWFPKSGEYARDKYPKYIKFINATSRYSQTCLSGPNRMGKTETLCFILTAHLTGLYPDWWMGKKSYTPTKCWAVGLTSEKVAEVFEAGLLGENLDDIGTGMIPRDLLIGKPVKKPGTVGVYKQKVRHVSGGVSIIYFKAYEQYDKGGFVGTKIFCICLDEDPIANSENIYSECMMRLIDKHNPGELRCAFTPISQGEGVIYNYFFPDMIATKDGSVPTDPDKFAIQISLDDVPHIPPKEKQRMKDSALPHDYDARIYGIRNSAAGAVYPVDWSRILIDPFPIPDWWPKVYGFDTGVKNNAAVWVAQNPETDTFYIYDRYYAGYEPFEIHTMAIKQKSKGTWMFGAADAFALNAEDGAQIIETYKNLGLNLIPAYKKNKDSGIMTVYQLFKSGRLFIFNHLDDLIKDLRKYRRDETGKIVKKDDHGPDAVQYALTTGANYMETEPTFAENNYEYAPFTSRNKYTGY